MSQKCPIIISAEECVCPFPKVARQIPSGAPQLLLKVTTGGTRDNTVATLGLICVVYLSLGMLNQYSGFIFFFPYDMMGVVMPPLRFSGFPIRSLK